jgi:hypothetical protein
MYPDEPIITVAFDPDVVSGDVPRFPEGKGHASVALVEHPEPRGRMRALIALMRNKVEHAYELTGYQPLSLADATLDWAKAKPSVVKSTVKIHRAADYEKSIPVMAFDLPPHVDEAFVEAALLKLMLSETDSTYSVLGKQNFYHSAHGVFAKLRERCGDPTLRVNRAWHFAAKPGDLVSDAAYSRAIAATGPAGSATAPQVSGPRVAHGRKPAKLATTKVLLHDVPMVNQNTDFAWVRGYNAQHPPNKQLPTGDRLCGVATLRMYYWYFDGVDLSEDEQVELINTTYRGEFSGEYAPDLLDATLGKRWHIKTGFNTRGTLEEIRTAIDERYPVPIGIIQQDSTISAVLNVPEGDARTAGEHYRHDRYQTGHWVLVVGYEKKGEETTAIFINDPNTGCRARLNLEQITTTAGSKIWRVLTEPRKEEAAG